MMTSLGPTSCAANETDLFTRLSRGELVQSDKGDFWDDWWFPWTLETESSNFLYKQRSKGSDKEE